MSKSAQGLRLLALPLAKRKQARAPDLIYFHPFLPPTSSSTAPSDPQKLPLFTRALNWAEAKWLSLGKAKGGWQLKVYTTGERVMDRIAYEEWSLKALDPSLGPKPWSTAETQQAAEPPDSASESSMPREKPAETPRGGTVAVIYPSIVTEDAVKTNLTNGIDYRVPHHRKMMVYWLLAAPCTLPFMLIPVVPNLPGFYSLWRIWSHRRAWQASSYLQSLVGARQLIYEPSEALNQIYNKASTQEAEKQGGLLLDNESVEALVEKFGLPDQARIDVRRAIQQVTVRLKEEEEKSRSS